MTQPYHDLKSGIWKIRKEISVHLRPFFDDKFELKRSLKTQDAYIAKTTAGGVIVEFESAIALLRQEKEQKITPVLLVWGSKAIRRITMHVAVDLDKQNACNCRRSSMGLVGAQLSLKQAIS